MKLILAGTSHGVPSAVRFCSCYILEVGENLYIFDAGAPAVDLLMRYGKNPENVRAFFNTHSHGDHIDGAPSLLSLQEWHFENISIDAFLPDEITKKAICDYVLATDRVTIPSKKVRMTVFSEGEVFDDGNIKVSAIEVKHDVGEDKCAYAFLIEAEGKSILYTGDMSQTLCDFPRIAFERHIDLIMSESAHGSVQTLCEIMDKVDTERFVITHIFPESKFEEFEKIKDDYRFAVHIASDGDIIEI